MVILQAPFFDDAAVVTLQYLDTLVQKDEMQKSQFFKSLHRILPKMPKVVGNSVYCLLDMHIMPNTVELIVMVLWWAYAFLSFSRGLCISEF